MCQPCKTRTALFAGSFNPFTIGHLSIVNRALHICDHVIVAIGFNINKPKADTDLIVDSVRKIFADNPNVSVEAFSGLTVDFARRHNVDFMIRGLRNASDFETEQNLADINRQISGIETVFIPTLPQLSAVSSSAVRELRAHGYDVSSFLP